MIKRVIKIILSLSGFALGVFFIILAKKLEIINLPEGVIGISIYILSGLLFAIITFIISPKVMDSISKMTKKLEKELEDVPTNEIILGAAGLIIGLVIAFFISQPFYSLPYVGTILSILVYLVMGYLGIRLAVRSKGDLLQRLIAEKNDPQADVVIGLDEGGFSELKDNDMIIAWDLLKELMSY